MKRRITDTPDIINEKSSGLDLKRTIEDLLDDNEEELASAKRRVTCLDNAVYGYASAEESDVESLNGYGENNDISVDSDKKNECHANSSTQPAKVEFIPIKALKREGASLDLSKMAQALEDLSGRSSPTRIVTQVIKPIVASSFNKSVSFSFDGSSSSTSCPFINRYESPASAASPFMGRDNQIQSPFLGIEDSRLKSIAFTQCREDRSFLQSPVPSDDGSCDSDILTF